MGGLCPETLITSVTGKGLTRALRAAINGAS
jgi:hypothetical protein